MFLGTKFEAIKKRSNRIHNSQNGHFTLSKLVRRCFHKLISKLNFCLKIKFTVLIIAKPAFCELYYVKDSF